MILSKESLAETLHHDSCSLLRFHRPLPWLVTEALRLLPQDSDISCSRRQFCSTQSDSERLRGTFTMGNHRPARRRVTSFLGLALLTRLTTAHPQDFSPCIRTWNSYLSNIADCGDAGSIQYCFSTVPDRVASDQIRDCFVSAGCTTDEASIEAAWTVKKCDEILLSDRGQWHKPGRRGQSAGQRFTHWWEDG